VQVAIFPRFAQPSSLSEIVTSPVLVPLPDIRVPISVTFLLSMSVIRVTVCESELLLAISSSNAELSCRSLRKSVVFPETYLFKIGDLTDSHRILDFFNYLTVVALILVVFVILFILVVPLV